MSEFDKAELNNTLRTRTLSGITWNAGAQIANQALAIVITTILMRLLMPEDFGLLTMALVFTGFANIFSKIGIAQALIQRKDIDEAHCSSAFWLSLLSGVLVAMGIVAITPWVTNFYNEPLLMAIMPVIASIYIIGATGRVSNALLRRQLNFRAVGLSTVLATGFSGMIAIGMAFANYGVWSLVVYQWLSGFVETAFQLVWAKWRPKLLFKRQAAEELFGFGVNLSAFQIFNYWTRNADNLLVGRVLGSSALGYYSRAYSLMLLPVTRVTDVVGSVMWSALARIQDDTIRVRRIVLRSVGMIGLVNFPMVLGLFVVADRIIPLVAGEQWIPAIPTFRILAFVGLLQSISSISIWIFQSQGRADLMFRWQAIKGIISIISFLVGVMIGSIEAVAVCYLFVSVVMFHFDLYISGKLIALSPENVYRSLSMIVFCAVSMAIIVWIVGLLLTNLWPSWLVLGVQIVVGMIWYGLMLHLLNVEAYQDLKQLLGEQLGKHPRWRIKASHTP